MSRVLAHGDIKIRHVGVERGADLAVAHVEFGGTHARLGRLDASVKIAELREKVLSAGHIMARLLDGKSCPLARGYALFDRRLGGADPAPRFLSRRRARIAATAGVGHLVGRHELALE